MKKKRIEIDKKIGEGIVKVYFDAKGDDIENLSFVASDKTTLLAALVYMIVEYCDTFEVSKEKIFEAVEYGFEVFNEDEEEESDNKVIIGKTIELSDEKAEEILEFLKSLDKTEKSKRKESK